MLRVFGDYPTSPRSVILCLLGLALLVGAALLGLASPLWLMVFFAVWVLMAFLCLPTRHLLAERIGKTRRLTITDRRPARMVEAYQRQLFDCAGLVGLNVKYRKVKDPAGNIRIVQIEQPRYPRLSALNPAPYGFQFDVELPGLLGVNTATATKNEPLIDGFISHLLRRAAPGATAQIEPISGSQFTLKLRLREEFSEIVSPREVR